MRSRIGVHLPSRTMRGGALTEKDKADLLFGLSLGVDYIALSFVRRADDLRLVRDIVQAWGADTPIIAKVETPDAVDNLEAVIAASDGAMVARGRSFPAAARPLLRVDGATQELNPGWIGGSAGLFCASFMQFITVSTVNFQTFSELAFKFTLTGQIVLQTMAFAFVMGFIGGMLPALRASRMKIVEALRAG